MKITVLLRIVPKLGKYYLTFKLRQIRNKSVTYSLLLQYEILEKRLKFIINFYTTAVMQSIQTTFPLTDLYQFCYCFRLPFKSWGKI